MVRMIKYAALPPLANLLLILLGLLLLRRYPKLGRFAILLGTLTLYLLSTSHANWVLSHGLEEHPVPSVEVAETAGAIVVLGGGRESAAPNWDGQDTISEAPLARLAEAARWHRRTGLPILLTGGSGGEPEDDSEATLMNRMLDQAFGLQATWLEQGSRTTRQNAQMSAPMLKADGIERILLVTHAAHMTRALPEFEHMGLEVIAAPMGFTSGLTDSSGAWIPRTYFLERSYRLLHEHLGILYYNWTR